VEASCFIVGGQGIEFSIVSAGLAPGSIEVDCEVIFWSHSMSVEVDMIIGSEHCLVSSDYVFKYWVNLILALKLPCLPRASRYFIVSLSGFNTLIYSVINVSYAAFSPPDRIQEGASGSLLPRDCAYA
jgi:hypothetical protein